MFKCPASSSSHFLSSPRRFASAELLRKRCMESAGRFSLDEGWFVVEVNSSNLDHLLHRVKASCLFQLYGRFAPRSRGAFFSYSGAQLHWLRASCIFLRIRCSTPPRSGAFFSYSGVQLHEKQDIIIFTDFW